MLETETLLVTFLAFMGVAVLVSYAAKRLRISYLVAMVLAGLVVSALRLGLEGPEAIGLEPKLILLIFLPGLLFEASYHIDLRQLRTNLRAILLLAIPGVLISTLLVGAALHWLLPLPWIEALLFGVLISATDPIAVVALFKELGVDKRLGIIIEGESLFNDGVAIIVYTILAGLATGNGEITLTGTTVDFLVTVLGGAMLGILAGWLFAELMKRTEDPLIDIALTPILAYGIYFLAEEGLHGMVSPVIAVVTAGIALGNSSAGRELSATASNMIVIFWEFTAFSINSAIFLMIGLEVEIQSFVDHAGQLLAAIGAILLARAVVVYLLRQVINTRGPMIPLSWAHVMFWGGIRGAVSIALALSLSPLIESRRLIEILTFGYVLFSVVVQGLTISPLLRWLGLSRRSERQREFESRLAKNVAARAALTAVNRLYDEHMVAKRAADRLRDFYECWINEHEEDLFQLIGEEPGLAETNRQLIRREIAQTQKVELRRLLQRGAISEEVFEEYIGQIDAALAGEVQRGWLLPSELLQELIQQPPESS
jgi:CPA1 family monovalent cation:H+ antiporter